MKQTVLILFICLVSLNGFSKVIDGIPSIDTAVKGFFDPLKKGVKNLDQAMTSIPSINGESRQYAESFTSKNPSQVDFKGQLQNTMGKDNQGGVMEYKELDSKSKLNGAYVIKTYQVRFNGGQVKKMQFKFLQPTREPEYQWVDAQFVD
jgi:hypothetical protein